MPKVSMIEGRNLLRQTEEQLDYYRNLLFQKSNVYNPSPAEVTTVREDATGSEVKKEVIPETKEQKMSVDSVIKKMDKLYVERNKLEVALTAAEAATIINY